VEGRRRIGQYDAFRRGMRDVALMPQGDVLQAYDRICANSPGHPTDTFGKYRIAFVRHSRGAFLSGLELLLSLADFRSLPMPDLQSHFLQRRSDNAERTKIFRVTVALYNLRRNIGRFQSQP